MIPGQPVVEVAFEFIRVINFSMQQNHVPVVRKLTIRNVAGSDLRNLTVEILSEPDFAVRWSSAVGLIPAGENFDLGIVDIKLSTKYLSELSERISGQFTLVISDAASELYKEVYSVDILAYDQWSGVSILPEILSAFVTPNNAEIPGIIRRAATILDGWTGIPSFDEYQTKNPDRVKKQMAAVFEAIAERQILYCTVPASFEETGQRIRLPETIFSQQMANCLDLSLLYAGCLESVGINPFVVIIKGHAFAGAWMVNDTFADSVNDDISLITKRIAEGVNELIVVEATCMNAGHKSTFDDAVRSAKNHLLNADDFMLFIDVKRSRFSGVRPMPLRIRTAGGWEIKDDITATREHQKPEEIATAHKIIYSEKIDVSKQQMWERKLLDLSLRNNLINLRVSRNNVQLIATNLSQMEDKLAAGDEFQVLPKPADWDNPLRNAGIYQSVNSLDPMTDLVKQELTKNRLRTYLPEPELVASLVSLYRSSRLSLEENGANMLYVALGVLKWYETTQSEKARYAPILLLPVEIIKKTAHRCFIIRSREEDAIMNITMLEMIRQDFGISIGGLETLPKDESGVDVKQVFNILRQAVMSQSRWDVEEQAFIGTFSFSRFIMWHDIHTNASRLRSHKVVGSLIWGKMEWDSYTAPPVHTSFDRHFHPSEIALPISADSSQLEAILAADQNQSFVLHGPPGTGKSQTITNIIANSLYKGKKVLFVAEKMAALSVVKSRLEAIGLSPFCLELHSNKSKKSAVLEQLKKTLEINKVDPPQIFQSEAERLHKLREELNEYVEALHKEYPFGYSLYSIIADHTAVFHAPDKVKFGYSTIKSLTLEKLTLWHDLAQELETAGKICRHPHNHALDAIHLTQYTQTVKNEAKELIAGYLTDLNEFRLKAADLQAKFHLDITLETRQQLIQLQIICDLLLSLPDTPAELFSATNIESTVAQVGELAVHGRRRDAMREELLKNYDESILVHDAVQTLAEWTSATQKWFLPKLFRQNAVRKEIRNYLKNRSGKVHDVPGLLQEIIAFRKEQSVIESKAATLAPVLGWAWNGGNCDWGQLEFISGIVQKLNQEIISLLESPAKARAWRRKMGGNLSEGRQVFKQLFGGSCSGYGMYYFKTMAAEAKLNQLLGVDFATQKPVAGNRIDNCAQYAQKWLDNIELLRDWVSWQQARSRALSEGLEPLVVQYETGALKSDEVVISFKKGVLHSCADFIFSNEAALSTFNGQLFEEKIRRFREISSQFEQLTKAELVAKLASKIPNGSKEAAQSSEMGILQRAIRNGGRGMSIRKLFDSVSNLLPRLSPCMLMSPISVAQYFDADTTRFDLVIFDEASQMPTCEAVGAIARADNVIVTGDPKQMPPTNFFAANFVDEENEKEDLESILDDCLALSMPEKRLKWHYRSKHESLIAFSNAKYYDNRLLTFPSTDDIAVRVKYVEVPGYYDRSKTRQNPAEAKAVVSEILMRLADPVLSRRSIGVVTFSSVQQTLIDDMLNDALRANPLLEAVALESGEPLFIKNLENVQGDERDVILFSVGYGPDREGKVNLNFGPLNRVGGERRLNVAVSRARYEMIVFSTLKAEQIDITRTSSEGVAGLKDFLEYAQKGKDILSYRNPAHVIKTESFAQLIAGRIRKKGYEVNTNIGCSGYRIDIGVVDTKNESGYLLGVLTDGQNYNAAKSAGDREIVQYDVLRKLGWNICRVWSADWWENPERVVDNLLSEIERLEGLHSSNGSDIAEPAISITIPESRVINGASAVFTGSSKARSTVALLYEVCSLYMVSNASSDEFLLQSNRQRVCSQILDVLRIEAPISRSLLIKRVLAAWGISRQGNRISTHFEGLFAMLQLKTTEVNGCVFFWNSGQVPGQYSYYRTPADESQKRDAEDLPVEEITNAVREILDSQISLPKEDLVKETARVFGFARAGSNVEAYILRGLEAAISKGFAAIESGRIVSTD